LLDDWWIAAVVQNAHFSLVRLAGAREEAP
jgi:hypothetical protein